MKDCFSVFQTRRKIVFSVLALIFIFTFIFSLQISVLYPTYSDEFEWKLISSRFFMDQGRLIYIFPACGNSYLIDTPLSWYPGRVLDSLIYQGSRTNALLRYMGLIQYGVLIVLFWQIAKIQSKLSSIKSFFLVISFFAIGVLPILLVLNRPEQPLLLYISFAIYLSVYQANKPNVLLSNGAVVTLVFCLLSNLIITAHPKGIYLLPVVLITYRQIVKSFAYFPVLLALSLFTVFQTVQVWSIRTACAESPWLEALVRSFTLNPGQLVTDPGRFFLQIVKNCIRSYTYIEQMLFGAVYQSQWLPSLDSNIMKTYTLWIINTLSVIAIVGIFGVIGFRFIKYKFNEKFSCNNIVIALIFSLLVITVMQTAKNFYESALILPLLLLLLLFLINPQDEVCRKFVGNVALPVLLVIGSISSYTRYVLFSDHLPQWKSVSSKEGVSPRRVEDFAEAQCGISTNASGLVVDRATYAALWKHPRPVFLSGLTGWYGTGTDYKITLDRMDSDGVVAMCAGLPKELIEMARQDSGVCCVSKPSLQRLIKD